MERFNAISAVALLLVLSLAACGGGGGESTPPPPPLEEPPPEEPPPEEAPPEEPPPEEPPPEEPPPEEPPPEEPPPEEPPPEEPPPEEPPPEEPPPEEPPPEEPPPEEPPPEEPPPSGSGSVSGSIAIPGGTLIDSDVADPDAPYAPNEDGYSQLLPNPVTLGGYATCPSGLSGEGCINAASTDYADFYEVDLAPGQVVNLYLAEDGLDNDLDLGIGDKNGNLLDASLSATNRESVTVPEGGALYILVLAYSGGSNYVLTITPPGSAGAAHAMRSELDFVPGEAIVSTRAGAAAKSLAQSLGAEHLSSVPGRFDRVRLGGKLMKSAAASDSSPMRYASPEIQRRIETLLAIKRLQRQSSVDSAWPNLRMRAFAVPNDAHYDAQWHYRAINAPAAWDLTQGSGDVLAAVIDTGVLLNHPDLSGKFDPADGNGYDFIASAGTSCDGDGLDGNADDPGGSFHGTHVAGTIAAATNNGAGVAGIGWNTRIMPLRVLGCDGGGDLVGISNAMLYAAGLDNASGQLPARRADVVNLSLGCNGCYFEGTQTIINDMRAAGTIVVAAAGNAGTTELAYPASYDGVVSVAAVGPPVGGTPQHAPYSQANSAVDIAAPGGDMVNYSAETGGILSTLGSDTGASLTYIYDYYVGTSMATPHVAGVVALMKTVNPDLTPAQFDSLLASGAISSDLGAAGRDNQYGYGLIDAAAAVREASELSGGGPPPETPLLAVSPESLNFGTATTALSLSARNAGSGNLTVNPPSDDAAWLEVGVEDADDNRITYAARVDRAGLGEGSYSATIRIESSANTVAIPVLMRVGGAADAAADAGRHYVLIVDADTGETVAARAVAAHDGAYAYAFDDISAGRYFIVAGTDNDNDGFICDGGEACGAWPTLGSYGEVEISGGALDGVDFGTGFSAAIVADAAAAPPVKATRGDGYRGFAVRPRPEASGPLQLRPSHLQR